MNIHWNLEQYRHIFTDQPLTKAQILERYEHISCECDEKPFHWTEERWNEFKEEEARSVQYAKLSWFN